MTNSVLSIVFSQKCWKQKYWYLISPVEHKTQLISCDLENHYPTNCWIVSFSSLPFKGKFTNSDKDTRKVGHFQTLSIYLTKIVDFNTLQWPTYKYYLHIHFTCTSRTNFHNHVYKIMSQVCKFVSFEIITLMHSIPIIL